MSVARGHHGCGIVFYGVVPNLVEGAPTTETIAQRCELNLCTFNIEW